MSSMNPRSAKTLERLFVRNISENVSPNLVESKYTLACICSPKDYIQHYLSFQRVLPKNGVMHLLDQGYLLFGLPDMSEAEALKFLNQVQSAQRIKMGISVMAVQPPYRFGSLLRRIMAAAQVDLNRFNHKATFE